MKIKRKIIVSAVTFVVLCTVAVLVIAEGTVIGNWRMRTVARQLEQSTALREAYGSGCSVTSQERGLQPGECFHMRVYHITLFQVYSDGVHKKIWVKWSNRDRGLNVRVHAFTEEYMPYTNTPEILK